MTVVIVGAGIGGLTLAAGLPNHELVVVERRPEASGIGAGLLLRDEALRALRASGVQVEGRRYRRMDLGLANGRVLPGAPRSGLALRRPELHAALLAATPHVDLRVSTTVTAFGEDSTGVDVDLSDGTTLRAEFLIGADGLGSSTRAALDVASNRRYSGAVCWRGLTDAPSDRTEPIEFWGRGLRVGVVPLHGGTYLYLTESSREPSRRRLPPLDEFRPAFPPWVDELIEQVPPADWLQNDLEELDRHAWGTDRVPLLGDAAHGFTPNLGEGAVQAILDAAALAAAIPNDRSRYPGTRRSQTRRIAWLSRRIGRVAQAAGRPARIRDLAMTPLSRRKA